MTDQTKNKETLNKEESKDETGRKYYDITEESEEHVHPFGKSKMTQRSPTRHQRSFSLTDPIDITLEKRAKRAREEYDEDDTQMLVDAEPKQIQELITEAQAEVTKMLAVITTYTNTKKEIKDAVIKLSYITDKLSGRKVNNWLNNAQIYHEKESERAPTMIATHQKVLKDASTQADMNNIQEQEDREAAEKIRNKIMISTAFEEIMEVVELEWPSCTYQNVEVMEGSPLLSAEGDLAIYTEDADMNKGIARLYGEKYPELIGLKNSPGEQEGLAYLVSITRIPEETGYKTNERYVFKTMPEPNPDKPRAEIMYESITKLKYVARKFGRSFISIPIPDNIETEVARKILESVFMGTKIKVRLHIPKRKKGNTNLQNENRSNEDRRRNRQYNTQAILIDPKERSYAELLKEVKEHIDLQEVGVDVKKVRKTRKGEMLLTIEGSEDKAEPLRTAIVNKIQNITTRTIKRVEKVFHIYDIDAITTKQEVKSAIEKALGTTNSTMEVKSLRPTASEEQVATIGVDQDEGSKLMKLDYIKIGWSQCKIKERVAIPRCYNCLQHGHRASSCDGPDKSKCCFNCGEEGHIANTCKSEAQCSDCNKKGHKSGTTRCLIFRKMLEGTRRKR